MEKNYEINLKLDTMLKLGSTMKVRDYIKC